MLYNIYTESKKYVDLYTEKIRVLKMTIISRDAIIHPLLFSVVPVLIIFSNSLNLISLKELVFSSLLSMSITIAVWIFFFLILKNKKKSAFIISFGLGLFFSYGYVYNYFSDLTFGNFYLRHLYLLPIYLTMSIVLLFYFIKTKKTLERPTKILNFISIIVIGILIVFVTYGYLDRVIHAEKILSNPNIPIQIRENPPNIYYIILDSYARPDVLKESYNYSDEQFISFLKDKDFYIASESHSNYRHTFLSLAASLNMEYINDLVDRSSKYLANSHRMYKLTDENKIMKIMKSFGYDVINFASRDGVTGNIRVADINICETNPYIHSQLTITEIKTSILEPVYLKFFRSFNNDRERCVFSELSELHQKDSRPFFVFAHILLPHDPYRFGPNGEDLMTNDEKVGYINQVEFVNKRVISTVDKILTESKTPPIIIIQSDTGTSLNSTDLNEIMKRKLTILNAYYMPENGSSVLYNTISPVNSFRVVLDKYFGQNYPLLDDRTYYSDYSHRLNFTDVTILLQKIT